MPGPKQELREERREERREKRDHEREHFDSATSRGTSTDHNLL
jgi:hypothetical protein